MTTAYFAIQEEIGITKHPGAIKSTDLLIKECNITKDSKVLIIGVGNGASAHYIKKKTGCTLIGIDISKRFIQHAKARGVDARLGNAESLNFKDSSFDAVISESVTAFTDKERSIKEYHRVLKKGGYLGLNETTWIKPPNKDIKDFAYDFLGGCIPESDWKRYLKGFTITYQKKDKLRISESLGEIRLNGLQPFKAILRLPSIYWRYRKDINHMLKGSLRIYSLSRYMGYSITVARK